MKNKPLKKTLKKTLNFEKKRKKIYYHFFKRFIKCSPMSVFTCPFTDVRRVLTLLPVIFCHSPLPAEKFSLPAKKSCFDLKSSRFFANQFCMSINNQLC
jgi:hypothetical protein